MEIQLRMWKMNVWLAAISCARSMRFTHERMDKRPNLPMIYHASVCRLDSDVIDFVAVFDECELDNVEALH